MLPNVGETQTGRKQLDRGFWFRKIFFPCYRAGKNEVLKKYGKYLAAGKNEVLKKYGKDLTALARAGKLDPVIGREDEIDMCIQILCCRSNKNPLLIGEPGVGKTAISKGLAQRIVKGDVPQALINRKLISLDMGALIVGAKFRGEFEGRLEAVLKEVTEFDGQIILFIDDIHTAVGTSSSGGAMDAVNLLKLMLGRRELRCICATTLDEYRNYIERNQELERRFQQVYVDEPSVEYTISILQGLREIYELHHGVHILNNALVEAAVLSDRYISGRLPEKAIDLVDGAAAKLKVQQAAREYEINRAVEVKYGNLNFLSCQLEGAKTELEKYKMSRKSILTEEVTADNINEIVSEWTGIPVSKLRPSEMENLEEELSNRVIGQDPAVKVVAEIIQQSRAGLSHSHRPIASFMFIGPTGVGKTELAKALAKHLFNTEEALVQIDMSQYMEKHDASRLLGAPRGYAGYKEGGQLTEAVRRRPYAVILFDGIEKAHRDVFNVLFQILDDGRVTDSQGRTVDFTNTVIIMTSNVNSLHIDYELLPKKMAYETMRLKVMKVARTSCPEFINRVDDYVVFQPLERNQINEIVRLQLEWLQKRFADKRVRIHVTDAAVELLGSLAYDPSNGAKLVKGVIQQYVEKFIANSMLRRDFEEDDIVLVDTEWTTFANGQHKLVLKRLE